MVRKVVIETRNHQDTYPLPPDAARVVEVQFSGWGYEKAWLLFECPLTISYMRVYAIAKPPEILPEVQEMLRAAHGIIGWRPLWFQFGDRLVVYPAPENDGDWLVVRYDNGGRNDLC